MTGNKKTLCSLIGCVRRPWSVAEVWLSRHCGRGPCLSWLSVSLSLALFLNTKCRVFSRSLDSLLPKSADSHRHDCGNMACWHRQTSERLNQSEQGCFSLCSRSKHLSPNWFRSTNTPKEVSKISEWRPHQRAAWPSSHSERARLHLKLWLNPNLLLTQRTSRNAGRSILFTESGLGPWTCLSTKKPHWARWIAVIWASVLWGFSEAAALCEPMLRFVSLKLWMFTMCRALIRTPADLTQERLRLISENCSAQWRFFFWHQAT